MNIYQCRIRAFHTSLSPLKQIYISKCLFICFMCWNPYLLLFILNLNHFLFSSSLFLFHTHQYLRQIGDLKGRGGGYRHLIFCRHIFRHSSHVLPPPLPLHFYNIRTRATPIGKSLGSKIQSHASLHIMTLRLQHSIAVSFLLIHCRPHQVVITPVPS